uniref:NADP-dependent oxidoreductase domain-containing protein n=1 Tax=Noctiluca scintillans TaxID=2966 RepID=A0A7S0ZQC0_NOCSC|mmetsp:Transcript_14561/g.40004  ORF Transcript_14561/g.40004 Transcript_14561/m.40004 type:complete len:311 (+) Transcript_14561:36-968(+)
MVGSMAELGPTSVNTLGMPMVGFGTYQMSIGEAEASVTEALKCGFRHIDSAEGYMNEEGTGRALKNSGVPREEMFVTTKVFPGNLAWGVPEKSFDDTITACRKSLEQLQLDYVDLYLIHAPFSSTRMEIYKALQEIKTQGLAKRVGVSNYTEQHFKEIADAGLPLPEVNQIELHPICQQKPTLASMAKFGTLAVAYSVLAPLSTWRTGEGQGGDKTAHLKQDCQVVVEEIAQKLSVSESQVLMRWGLQKGYVVLTKSTRPERIRDNFDVFGFEISSEDMQNLDAQDQQQPIAWAANGTNPMDASPPLANN